MNVSAPNCCYTPFEPNGRYLAASSAWYAFGKRSNECSTPGPASVYVSCVAPLWGCSQLWLCLNRFQKAVAAVCRLRSSTPHCLHAQVIALKKTPQHRGKDKPIRMCVSPATVPCHSMFARLINVGTSARPCSIPTEFVGWGRPVPCVLA